MVGPGHVLRGREPLVVPAPVIEMLARHRHLQREHGPPRLIDPAAAGTDACDAGRDDD